MDSERQRKTDCLPEMQKSLLEYPKKEVIFMFGIRDTVSGKIEPCTAFYVENLDERFQRVPKDYINHWASGHKCEQEGCFDDGSVECRVPDSGYPVPPETLNTIEHFCPEHAYENSYCSLCGEFWGGIESFDFDNPSHLCEHCIQQVSIMRYYRCDACGKNCVIEHFDKSPEG